MDYSYTKSGNVIAKSARVQGAQFIVNQGLSYIGKETQVHGERNNGKPVISWGKYVVLDDGCEVIPAERNGTFYPLIIGHDVYFGKSSYINAASVGNYVYVGEGARISEFAVLKDGAVVAPNTVVPPHTVVGPAAKYVGSGSVEDLPDSATAVIQRYCKLKLDGIAAEFPFV